MVLVSQVITEAYRESNNIAVGQTPEANEQAEGLLLFNRLLRSVFGNEAGDTFTTVGIGNNNITTTTFRYFNTIPTTGWYPSANTRLVFNHTLSETLNLNPNAQDGERVAIQDASGNFSTYTLTVNGNGRTIGGANSLVLNTNSIQVEYFYRADKNDWMKVQDLLVTDTFPFPEEFEDMFIIGLAMRLNPRNGTQMDPQSIQAYKRSSALFKARYQQRIEQNSEEGITRLPSNSAQAYRISGANLNSNQRFNLGYLF